VEESRDQAGLPHGRVSDEDNPEDNCAFPNQHWKSDAQKVENHIKNDQTDSKAFIKIYEAGGAMRE
jgi:hypothetical protein